MLSDEAKLRIDASAASSARGRTILVVMIVASVLVFASWWNGREESWLSAQYIIADTLLQMDNGLKIEDPELERRATTLKDAAGWDRPTLEKIKQENYQAWFENGVLVEIPFFGVSVHAGDLGLLGGFTFVVVLMWLIFSLAGERTNLQTTFDRAREAKQLDATFEILAMRQVLTVPSLRAEKRSRLWGKLPKLLFLLPLMTHALVVHSDRETAEVGRLISPSSASAVLTFGLVALGLIAALTIAAFVLSEQIDGLWKRAANETQRGS